MAQKRNRSRTQPREAWRTRAKRLAPYLPGTVVRQILSNQPLNVGQANWVQTAVLFADLSGFTPMAEQLAQDGPRGAETLNRTLLLTFTTLINAIHSAGGDVGHFHGDAMLAYFPDEDGQAAMRALACAQFMQRLMSTSLATVSVTLQNGQTLPFHLSMRVGVAYGRCCASLLAIDEQQLEFVLAGAPVDRAVEAEGQAAAGQVVADQAVLQQAGLPAINPFRLVDEILPISTGSNLFTWGAYDLGDYQRLAEIAPRFLPPTLTERLSNSNTQAVAEHRTVTSLFLLFDGLDFNQAEAAEQLQQYVRWVNAVLSRFSGANGRLNRVLTGDKGNHLHLIFGAPVAPAAPQQAVRCALALQAERPSFITSQKIGLATGEAFACAVGANKRREYTVVGRVVNLSARLMQQATDGSIILDDKTAALLQNQFRLEPQGSVPLKGMHDPTPTLRVVGEIRVETDWQNRYTQWQGKPHGWTDEVEQLKHHLQQAYAGQGCLIVVQTTAGMGQQHLLEAAVSDWAARTGTAQIGIAQPQQQQPLAPFPAFQQQQQTTPLSQMVDQLCQQAHKRPLLLILENYQYADPITVQFITLLADRLHEAPIALLLTTSVGQQALPKQAHVLTAADLPPARIRTFLVRELGTKNLPPQVEVYLGLQDEAGNEYPLNPHLLQVTLEAMWAQGVLTQGASGQIEVNERLLAKMQVPNTIGMLLQTSLDLLPSRTVSLLQIGAVAGRQFTVAAVTAVSGSRPTTTSPIPLLLRRVAELGIIQPVAESQAPAYRFQQALLHRVIYQGLPFARRQTIHAALADYYRQASESLSQNLRMAEHYRLAGQPAEAIRQLIKQAEKRAAQPNRVAALRLLETAQQLLPSLKGTPHQETAVVLTQLQLPLLFALGHFYQAEALAKHSQLASAEKTAWLAQIAYAQGNFDDVNHHLGQISAPSLKASHHWLSGVAYLRQGKREQANGRLQQALEQGDFGIQTMTQLALAELARQRQQPSRTEYHLSRAEACLPQIKETLLLGQAWRARAQVLRRIGQIRTAQEAAKNSVYHLASQGPYWHVLGLIEQTAVYILQEQKTAANHTLREAFSYLIHIDPCRARLVAQRLSKRLQTDNS